MQERSRGGRERERERERRTKGKREAEIFTGSLKGAGEPFYDEQKALGFDCSHGELILAHFSAEKQGCARVGHQDLIFKGGRGMSSIGREDGLVQWGGH